MNEKVEIIKKALDDKKATNIEVLDVSQQTSLGDYFIVGDIDDTILRPLKGVRLEREALEKALPERLDTAILNLRKADFIDLLL